MEPARWLAGRLAGRPLLWLGKCVALTRRIHLAFLPANRKHNIPISFPGEALPFFFSCHEGEERGRSRAFGRRSGSHTLEMGSEVLRKEITREQWGYGRSHTGY